MKNNIIKIQQFWSKELELVNQETSLRLDAYVEARIKEIKKTKNIFDVLDLAQKSLKYIWETYDSNRGLFGKIEKMVARKSDIPTDFPHQPERIIEYKNLLWETILDLAEDFQTAEYSNNKFKDLFQENTQAAERERERERESKIRQCGAEAQRLLNQIKEEYHRKKSALKKKIEEQEQAYQAVEEKLKKEQEDFTARQQSLESQLETTKSQLGESQQELGAVQQKLNKEKRKNLHQSRELNAKKRKLNQAYQNSQTNYRHCQDQINIKASLTQQLTTLQQELNAAQAEINYHLGVAELAENYKNQLTEAKQSLAQAQENNHHLTYLLNQHLIFFKSQKSQWMKEKDGWQDKVDNLKNLLSEKQTKQAEVEKLFNQMHGFYEKEIEELKQQKQVASDKQKKLVQENNHWIKDYETLANFYHGAKQQSSELRDLINQKNSSLNKLTNKKNHAKQKIRGLVQEQKNQEGISSLLARWLVEINSELEAIKTDRDKWQKKWEEHICPPVDNRELTRLRQENQKKEQKIGELEQVIKELRNKPPIIQTIDQPTQTEAKPEKPAELNDFAREKESLSKIISQQQATIQQLQTQLQQTQAQEPWTIIKKIPTTDLTTIQQLQTKLRKKEQTITRLHITWLLFLGVSVLLLGGLISLLRKKKVKS